MDINNFMDESGAISISRILGGQHKSPGQPRYISPNMADRLASHRIRQMEIEAEKNIKMLEEIERKRKTRSLPPENAGCEK